jgi:glutamyl-tRNA reductase
VSTEEEITQSLLQDLFHLINSRLSKEELNELIAKTFVYEGEEALTHLFNVSASLDSLVVGEREIITQVRKAYEFCNLLDLPRHYSFSY